MLKKGNQLSISLTLRASLLAHQFDLQVMQNLCELHCHLDGSLRVSTFLELIQSVHDELPASNMDDTNQCNAVATFETEDDVLQKLAFQVGWDLPRCLQSFAITLKVSGVCK